MKKDNLYYFCKGVAFGVVFTDPEMTKIINAIIEKKFKKEKKKK